MKLHAQSAHLRIRSEIALLGNEEGKTEQKKKHCNVVCKEGSVGPKGIAETGLGFACCPDCNGSRPASAKHWLCVIHWEARRDNAPQDET